jgi:hypothetical protein
VEGQGGGRKRQRLGNRAGFQALRSLLDQQAEDAQAGFLRKRGQLIDGLDGFHGFRFYISGNVKTLYAANRAPVKLFGASATS